MARNVTFEDVLRRIGEFGERATLITVNSDGRPHTVSVEVHLTAERLVVAVGARTRENLLARPGVSLLWHPAPDGIYQLIVDGVAQDVGDDEGHGSSTVSIVVERGILHRLAGVPGSGPTCVALGET